MRDSTALPDLQMLATEALLPHEDCDPRRIERLAQRILQDGCLKNPPVVAAKPVTFRDGGDNRRIFQTAFFKNALG